MAFRSETKPTSPYTRWEIGRSATSPYTRWEIGRSATSPYTRWEIGRSAKNHSHPLRSKTLGGSLLAPFTTTCSHNNTQKERQSSRRMHCADEPSTSECEMIICTKTPSPVALALALALAHIHVNIGITYEGCLFSQRHAYIYKKYRHPGSHIHVNMGIRVPIFT